jgi:hypothetical protein
MRAKHSDRKAPSPAAAETPLRAARLRSWAVVVLLPFALSRLVLELCAWLVRPLPRSLEWGGEVARRGFAYTDVHWLDVWARWDSGWYLDIIQRGYQPGPFLVHRPANLAFFPLYPQAVRLLYRLLPAGWQTPHAAVVLGLVVANACALGALTLLARHLRTRIPDGEQADRAVLALLAFPTGFLLSCLYSESMFLLCALGAYHLAWRQRWWLAGLAGALAAAARPTGVLMVLPLGWLYLASVDLRPSRIRPAGLFLALPVAGFLLYAAYIAHLTGDRLAVFHMQGIWGRSLSSPTALWFGDRMDRVVLRPLDQLLSLAYLALAASLTAQRRWRADGLVLLAVLASFVFTGTSLSALRFLLVAFPAYLWLANLRPRLFHGYLLAATAIQIALWVRWAQMAWVG